MHAYRQTYRQTDRHACIHTYIRISLLPWQADDQGNQPTKLTWTVFKILVGWRWWENALYHILGIIIHPGTSGLNQPEIHVMTLREAPSDWPFTAALGNCPGWLMEHFEASGFQHFMAMGQHGRVQSSKPAIFTRVFEGWGQDPVGTGIQEIWVTRSRSVAWEPTKPSNHPSKTVFMHSTDFPSQLVWVYIFIYIITFFKLSPPTDILSDILSDVLSNILAFYLT